MVGNDKREECNKMKRDSECTLRKHDKNAEIFRILDHRLPRMD